MAETIRYDTSDDPVAAQQIAEKEAESLKIGEEKPSEGFGVFEIMDLK